jgi:hypothetical protein
LIIDMNDLTTVRRPGHLRAWMTAIAGVVLLCSFWPAASAKTVSRPYTWKQVTIVGGGFVDGIVFSRKVPGLIYLRTDIGGAYRWDQGATKWESMSHWISAKDWNYTGTESIAADPTNPNRVYMAVGTYTNDWAGNGAILRSGDRGHTWKVSVLPFKNGGNEDGRFAGERLAVDPNAPNILFFGTRNNGLWRSEDYGAIWNPVPSFPVTGRTNGIGTVFVLFDPTSGSPGGASGTIYVGESDPNGGIYRSSDGGAAWTLMSNQPTGMLPNHAVLSSSGVLYVTYGDHPGPNGISAGAVWKYVRNVSQTWKDITPIPAGGFGYGGLSVDAQHPNTVMVSTMDRWGPGDDLFRSLDAGAAWTSIRAHAQVDDSLSPWLTDNGKVPFGHWIGSLAIDPFHSGHVLFGTGWTCNGSEDVTNIDHGGVSHWTIHAAGIEETVVNGVISTPTGAHVLSVMWDLDGFRSVDLDTAPSQHYEPSWGRNEAIDYAELNPNIVARLTGGNNNPMGASSTDNGVTWIAFKATATGDGTIAVSADGSAFVVTSSSVGTEYSRDGGATWTACSGVTQGAHIASDRVNPSRFYGFDEESGTVYASTDGGDTFAPVGTCSAKGGSNFHAVPGKEGDLWLDGDNGLFHSTDGGQTWDQDQTFTNAHQLGFGKAAPGASYPAVFVVGTVNGVYGFFRSDDAGSSWVRVNDDQHQFGSINAISGDLRVYGRIYIASANFGIQYGDIAP